jgi:hypothetical protein
MVHPFGFWIVWDRSGRAGFSARWRVTIPGKNVAGRTLPQGLRVMLAGSKIYRKRKLGWGV